MAKEWKGDFSRDGRGGPECKGRRSATTSIPPSSEPNGVLKLKRAKHGNASLERTFRHSRECGPARKKRGCWAAMTCQKIRRCAWVCFFGNCCWYSEARPPIPSGLRCCLCEERIAPAGIIRVSLPCKHAVCFRPSLSVPCVASSAARLCASPFYYLNRMAGNCGSGVWRRRAEKIQRSMQSTAFSTDATLLRTVRDLKGKQQCGRCVFCAGWRCRPRFFSAASAWPQPGRASREARRRAKPARPTRCGFAPNSFPMRQGSRLACCASARN